MGTGMEWVVEPGGGWCHGDWTLEVPLDHGQLVRSAQTGSDCKFFVSKVAHLHRERFFPMAVHRVQWVDDMS